MSFGGGCGAGGDDPVALFGGAADAGFADREGAVVEERVGGAAGVVGEDVGE